MIAGFHSPLPPVRSGVADYSAALLEALRKHGKIAVGANRADVHLYHIGNNQLHREIYQLALRRPGVVVLHDAMLQHMFLGWVSREEYIEEFVYNYGEWQRGLAERLWSSRAQSGAAGEFFRYPMLKRIVEASRAVVVHNAAAAHIVRRHVPAALVREIPHLYATAPSDPIEAERLRMTWRVPAGCFVFSVFGYLRETKRLPVILKAFDEVRKRGLNAVLVVAGKFVSSDLARAMLPQLARDDARYLDWSAPRRFGEICSAVDACINLRYPAAGETSGIAIRMMGQAKPVILSEGEESSAFPPQTCFRVGQGVSELDELVEYMGLVARSPAVAREMGRQAAEHIRRVHSPETVAAAYWELLCDCRN